MRPFESSVLSPLRVLYASSRNLDVRALSLKVLLHVLEVPFIIIIELLFKSKFVIFIVSFFCCEFHIFQRYGERLYDSWSEILEMLRFVYFFYDFHNSHVIKQLSCE